MTTINIKITSDTVCPWCYIGLKRLTTAISTFTSSLPPSLPKPTFNIIWSTFYLNPSSPPYPGISKRDYYASKFGIHRVEGMFERLRSVGQSDGVGIGFSFGGRIGNTRDSQRLVWFAGQEQQRQQRQQEKEKEIAGGGGGLGLQTRVVEELFKLYFEEEGNITDWDVLVLAAERAGLDGEIVRRTLFPQSIAGDSNTAGDAGDADPDVGGKEVDEEAREAASKAVSGVPYFEIEGHVVEGADEVEVFLEIFERVLDQKRKQKEGGK